MLNCRGHARGDRCFLRDFRGAGRLGHAVSCLQMGVQCWLISKSFEFLLSDIWQIESLVVFFLL